MKASPKGILVIHNDVSDGVARMLTSYLSSKGNLVSSRNIRYGFNATMYKVVIAVGTKEVRAHKNVILLNYKSFAAYQESGGQMPIKTYHDFSAQKMIEELQESRLF